MNMSNSLNDILQLWMTCPATKLLMEMATECFAAMSVSASGAPFCSAAFCLPVSHSVLFMFHWACIDPVLSACLCLTVLFVFHSVLFVFHRVLFVFCWACIDPVLSACVSQYFVNMMLNVHRIDKAY